MTLLHHFVDDKYLFSWNWKTRLKFLLPSQVGKINQYKLLLNAEFSYSLKLGVKGITESREMGRYAVKINSFAQNMK